LQEKWKKPELKESGCVVETPFLSLIKFCWNILAFIRGKPSRHCSYEMEWEYVEVTGGERKDNKK
jgi:hypothetical protein